MTIAAAADKGWENYPKRLDNYDPLREDGISYDTRLTNDSKRLFTEKGNINVDVLDIFRDEFIADNKKPVTYQDADAFEDCLTSSPPNREFRFYTLKPANPNVISRSRVAIPEDNLRKLLTVHQVMPGFVDFLQAFGRRASSSDTGFGGCKRRIEYTSATSSKQRAMKSYEICYNLKFAEEHGRKEKEDEPPKDPWSVRQTCIYQKFEYEKKSSTWIMVQPSSKATDRLNEVFKARAAEDIEETLHNPMDIHLVFLSSASEKWRWYYNYLESELNEMTTGAMSSSVGTRTGKKAVTFGNYNPGIDFDVSFDNVQELQRFEEKVQRFLLALETNRDTIRTLQKHNDQLRRCGLGLEEHHFTTVDDSLDTFLTDLAIYKRNVDTLLQRIRGRSKLLYNILDYRNAEINHRHGQKNVTFAELGRKDTDLMMKMTKRTTREAVAVKIVTFVTLFYLPATFVATFLSANCVKFVEETVNGRVISRMAVSKDLILFAAITGPLMCITLSIWFIWDRVEKRRVIEECGEKPDHNLEAANRRQLRKQLAAFEAENTAQKQAIQNSQAQDPQATPRPNNDPVIVL